MSHRVSLVKSSPLQIRELQWYERTTPHVLHPYIAHGQCLLTGGSFPPFPSVLLLRTPHATYIYVP